MEKNVPSHINKHSKISDFRTRLVLGMEHLTLEQHEITRMWYYDDLTSREISLILSISKCKVHKQLKTIHSVLRLFTGEKDDNLYLNECDQIIHYLDSLIHFHNPIGKRNLKKDIETIIFLADTGLIEQPCEGPKFRVFHFGLVLTLAMFVFLQMKDPIKFLSYGGQLHSSQQPMDFVKDDVSPGPSNKDFLTNVLEVKPPGMVVINVNDVVIVSDTTDIKTLTTQIINSKIVMQLDDLVSLSKEDLQLMDHVG